MIVSGGVRRSTEGVLMRTSGGKRRQNICAIYLLILGDSNIIPALLNM